VFAPERIEAERGVEVPFEEEEVPFSYSSK
jgi:hypothetical protein